MILIDDTLNGKERFCQICNEADAVGVRGHTQRNS